MNLNERIKFLINVKCNGKESQFTKNTGLSNGFLKGITNTAQPKTIAKILERYPEINKMWLLTGEGEPFDPQQPMPETKYPLEYNNSINDLLKQIKDKDRLIATLEELKDRYKLELEKLTKENEQLKEEIINLKSK